MPTNLPKASSVQISTPKTEYGGRNRLSIDRLSIIPKFEKSPVSDDIDDFEVSISDIEHPTNALLKCPLAQPYQDESSPLVSGTVMPGQTRGSGSAAAPG